MSPEVDEGHVDLLHVGGLLDARVSLSLVIVDLELELLLDVHPERLQQVLGISVLVQEPELAQVSILEEGLASVDFGLVVLPVHEDVEEAIGGLEAEDLQQVALLVVDDIVRVLASDTVQGVVGIDDLLDGHA